MIPAPPGWLTVAGFAERKDFTVSTARRWIALGWLAGDAKADPRMLQVPTETLHDFEPPKPGPKSPYGQDGDE